MNAASESGVNPYILASMILQEQGSQGTGRSISGTVSGYQGYYNFFNINVYGTNKIVNGMVYAMNNGWNTPYKAILGGSKFIRNGYIGVNQDTVYYEKFDVSTTNGHYDHQYQQNLAAVVQETNTTYKSYVDFGNYFNKEITFTIPVYITT